jgi:RNA-directed DNA polymerase
MGGFFNYHTVPTNSRALAAFRYHVTVLWECTLPRRSQRDRTTWDRIAQLAEEWLPKSRILHPWPNVRFAVKGVAQSGGTLQTPNSVGIPA